jgi:GT2 family glycosyltransferase
MDIQAIIATFNSGHIIGKCLSTLIEQGIGAIVVDNASTDNTTEVAATFGAKVIENAKNLGFGVANNIGASAASAEYLLFLNPDIEIDESIKNLAAAIKNYPDFGMIAPKIVEDDGRVFLQPRSLLSPANLNVKTMALPNGDACYPFLSGACFVMRKSVFAELGGFDKNIFLFYEDDDLCRRLWDKKQPLIHCDEWQAKHGRGKSSKPNPDNIYKVRYHMAYSRAYVARKYGIKTTPIVDVVKFALKYTMSLLSFNKATMARYNGSLMGTLDGMKKARGYPRASPPSKV